MFNLFKKNKTLNVKAPMKGEYININETPDHVFSNKMLGDGIAIKPKEEVVHSPVEGTIEMIFHTNHAVGLKTKEGIEILIHIGIDTVELGGEGFHRITKEGDIVKVGDPLIKFDRRLIKEKGKSDVVVMVVTKGMEIKKLKTNLGTKKIGEDVIEIIYE
ncbi:PTS sugar transporter subunit IIA [Oceanirhabdus sp. W0125-5]|uniref:PTS sugar transporter subunit IIA n=1 Tax=Oceanirhabdus sp. W0125-5 TaxID=2999116 RepID=UPI0022F30F1D|nr:PTS glucose transporter subunit IIA [Oceanirhabdus sp. W0125-5]WBW99175.1 PTS glucose transporter subunit IIA [Oceanirhabdus sp. W0125-5]